MVKKTIKNKIEKFKKIMILNNISFDSLILFGSHARGLGYKDSDIDLCLITSKKGVNIYNLQSNLNFLAGINGLPIEIIVTTKKKFKTNTISPILHQIKKYGIPI